MRVAGWVGVAKSFAMFSIVATGPAACSNGSQTLPPIDQRAPTTEALMNQTRVAVTLAAETSELANGEMPRSADSIPGDRDTSNNFIDSVGVNTKMNVYGANPYANHAALKAPY